MVSSGDICVLTTLQRDTRVSSWRTPLTPADPRDHRLTSLWREHSQPTLEGSADRPGGWAQLWAVAAGRPADHDHNTEVRNGELRHCCACWEDCFKTMWHHSVHKWTSCDFVFAGVLLWTCFRCCLLHNSSLWHILSDSIKIRRVERGVPTLVESMVLRQLKMWWSSEEPDCRWDRYWAQRAASVSRLWICTRKRVRSHTGQMGTSTQRVNTCPAHRSDRQRETAARVVKQTRYNFIGFNTM